MSNELFQPLLRSAQHIINTHHKNESEFFSKCSFSIEFAQETDEAFGFVDGTFPNYRIGIHELFIRWTDEDQRFIIMTIVHELLHIIHADWNENQVQHEEYRLANLAGYFDTLQRRDGAYLKRVRNFRDLNQGGSTGFSRSPLTIIKERYAKGEITKEEFDKLKEDLYEDENTELIKFKSSSTKEELSKKEDREVDALIEKITQKSKEEEYGFVNRETTKYVDVCCALDCNIQNNMINGKYCKFCNNFCCIDHLLQDKHNCS